jgi:hypothetical protein
MRPAPLHPTPEKAPDHDPEFMRLLELTEGLRSEQLIVPRIDPTTKEALLEIRNDPEHAEAIAEIKQLRGLDRPSTRPRAWSRSPGNRTARISIGTSPWAPRCSKFAKAAVRPTRPSWRLLRYHWFRIVDNDLESKSTFMLLTQLFRLQAGAAKSITPALTIPLR